MKRKYKVNKTKNAFLDVKSADTQRKQYGPRSQNVEPDLLQYDILKSFFFLKFILKQQQQHT